MPSRQGKIALQLTQWVGGTIVSLMFVFVIADYFVQSHLFRDKYEQAATRGVEGLRTILERQDPTQNPVEVVKTYGQLLDYTEGQEVGFVVVDTEGTLLVSTSGALPNDLTERERLLRIPAGPVELRKVRVGGWNGIAAVGTFETKSDTPVQGTLAYIVIAEQMDQLKLKAWATRSVMVLIMIIGTMLAVRIPVRKFVVAPIDGLFMAAYAASKDDFRKLPVCTVDNEFTELYDMFGRLLGHLADTRVGEPAITEDGQMPDMEKPLE